MKLMAADIDLAKSAFQAHGANDGGKSILEKSLRRHHVLEFFANMNPCLIGMEASVRGTSLGNSMGSATSVAPRGLNGSSSGRLSDRNGSSVISYIAQRNCGGFLTATERACNLVRDHLHVARDFVIHARSI